MFQADHFHLPCFHKTNKREQWKTVKQYEMLDLKSIIFFKVRLKKEIIEVMMYCYLLLKKFNRRLSCTAIFALKVV